MPAPQRDGLKTRRQRRRADVGSMVLMTAVMAACAKTSDAPTQTGVCWTMTRTTPKPSYALLSRGDDNLETCAMHLELTRIAQHRAQISGAYQGQFIFVTRVGVGSSESLDGQRFTLFTPGQRQALDGQITELLQAQTAPGKAAPGESAPGKTGSGKTAP